MVAGSSSTAQLGGGAAKYLGLGLPIVIKIDCPCCGCRPMFVAFTTRLALAQSSNVMESKLASEKPVMLPAYLRVHTSTTIGCCQAGRGGAQGRWWCHSRRPSKFLTLSYILTCMH